MQPDAEHQQNHVHFGKLAGKSAVGDETGSEGSDEDAGDEIADQRRQLHPVGQVAEGEGENEGDRNSGDEWNVVGYAGFRDV